MACASLRLGTAAVSPLTHLVKGDRVERAEDGLLWWVDGGAGPFLLQESLKSGHVWFLELLQQHAAPGWLHQQRLQLGWSASMLRSCCRWLDRRRRCRHRGALLLLLLFAQFGAADCGQALAGNIAEGRGPLGVRPWAAAHRTWRVCVDCCILAAHARQGAVQLVLLVSNWAQEGLSALHAQQQHSWTKTSPREGQAKGWQVALIKTRITQ